MNNSADGTTNTPSVPVEPFAEAFTDLGLALMSPSFCPERLERFEMGLRRIQELFGEEMPGALWIAITSFVLGRQPTPEERAALGFAELPDEPAVRDSFKRALVEKLNSAGINADLQS